jgi:hypothetical protein
MNLWGWYAFIGLILALLALDLLVLDRNGGLLITTGIRMATQRDGRERHDGDLLHR